MYRGNGIFHKMILDALQLESAFTPQEEEWIDLTDLTVLVGPNNAGKSQTLSDIGDIMKSGRDDHDAVILDGVRYSDEGEFKDVIEEIPIHEDPENDQVHLVGSESNISMSSDNWRQLKQPGTVQEATSSYKRRISAVLFSHINARSRLEIATHTPNEGNRYNPTTIMESLYFSDEEVLETIGNAFRETFNKDILFDYSSGSSLQFVVGDEITDPPDRPAELGKFIEENALTPLDNEGDGYISFVGVISSMLLSRGRVLLLDEPAAFLHPPQARVLGRWVAKQANMISGQVIISTHNSDFLSGLLQGGGEVQIYRLNRPAGDTHFHEMSPRTTQKLSEEPLLSSQRVIRSVFHEGVVVCEGGEDRSVYRAVAVNEHDEQDVLFIDALGKYSVKKIIEPLADSEIPIASIVDFDIFNDRDELRKLLTSSPKIGKYEEIEHILATREEMAKEVDQSEEWKKGIKIFSPKIQDQARDVLDELKGYGIFVVPHGPVESWMTPDLGSQTWVEATLQEIDEGRCDPELSDFIQEVADYLNAEYRQLTQA